MVLELAILRCRVNFSSLSGLSSLAVSLEITRPRSHKLWVSGKFRNNAPVLTQTVGGAEMSGRSISWWQTHNTLHRIATKGTARCEKKHITCCHSSAGSVLQEAHARNMEAKIFLAVSLTILQLCTLQVAAAQPSPAPGAEHRCSSRCPVQKKPISVSESRQPPLHCTKAEGKRPTVLML